MVTVKVRVTRTISDRWTPARHAWLERLALGPAVRGRSIVGFECQKLGWTTWKHEDPLMRELLTDAGRAKLAAWQAEGLSPGDAHA